MTTHTAYSEANPELKAAMIKDGFVHLNASMAKLQAEFKKFNAWIIEYPAQNEVGRVEDLNITTLHHYIDSFNHNSDDLQNEIIAAAQNLDKVKVHISRKAIKTIKPNE
jgi:hypothetical protein